MFFNRRQKESKEFLKLEELTELDLRFRERMDEIGRMPRADEQIFALERLRIERDDMIFDAAHETLEKADRKRDITGLGGRGIGTGAMVGITLASGGTALPLALGVLFAGYVGGAYAGAKARKSAIEHLSEENKDMLELLREQVRSISDAEQKVLADNLDEIAKSPRRMELFSRYPNIGEAFAAAAATRIASGAPGAEIAKPRKTRVRKPAV